MSGEMKPMAPRLFWLLIRFALPSVLA